ncbi:Cytochrome P450 71A4 [Morella rubra]|uniref:Cytochrome P450 71A4 n=1 Tax=Morella rubra TaxID=262757 RepID=A0A6A1W5N3_9ROSI|nr:Cytochrome P450 71A4 [Morella rubra]
MSEFINAFADSSTMMLQWVMAYIVKHPHIQATLFAEISGVVGHGAKEVKEEDLHMVNYLKAVILECLRIHPPNTSLIPHTVMEDVELCGYTIYLNTKMARRNQEERVELERELNANMRWSRGSGEENGYGSVKRVGFVG